MSVTPLDTLQQRLGHEFRDPALLLAAVTHPSFGANLPQPPENYQRLEFLGDAVLQHLLSEALFHACPADREGALSARRAALLNGRALAALAARLGLPDCLRLGPSEDHPAGRARVGTLEDVFEALAGALFLDAGLEAVRLRLLPLFGDLDSPADVPPIENPKGRLQEKVQPVHGNGVLRYETTQVGGPDHGREYEACIYLHDRLLATGRGSSKKQAEETAARAALDAPESEFAP